VGGPKENYLTVFIKYYETTESHNDMKPHTQYEETLQVSWQVRVFWISSEMAVQAKIASFTGPQKDHPMVWFHKTVCSCCWAKILNGILNRTTNQGDS
jgi:Ni,Fe-hydrogenase I small subunit